MRPRSASEVDEVVELRDEDFAAADFVRRPGGRP